MQPRTQRHGSHSLAHFVLAACTLVFGVLACAIGSHAPEGAQYWWSDRGPVVPHDSFPADCKLCHAGGDWRTIRSDFQFDHAKETGVALEGAHRAAECLRCHNDRGSVKIYADRGCSGCHEDVHKGRLGSDCASCHDQTSFRPLEQIAKHNQTRFPLVGVHAATACFACHPGAQVGQFAPTDAECVTCHAKDLAKAVNPDHAANGWVDRCDECHIPTTWNGAGFNHAIWPLTGVHATTTCTKCHVGGVFKGTPTNCVACHQSDYNNTTNPNHIADNISTNCQQCHTTSSWQGAHFDHTGITSGCVTCHQADYNGTTNPNHAALGISTSCEHCHNTNTWAGASFDHTGITNGCVNCHQTEYNNTTNPNHTAAGFPTTCETCHDTIDWAHGTFSHTQFPITSGKHTGFKCVDCHPNANNFVQFACINCHEHTKTKTDSHHQGIGGYAYNSNACYACHPNGKAN